MHYLMLALLPKTENVETTLAALMAPHRETYDDKTDELPGFWDWYQIGGRWTGHLSPDYSPEADPRNIEPCRWCEGTGKTTSAVGATCPAYIANVGKKCFQCDGTGKKTKWSTEWAKYSGDIVETPFDVPEDKLPYTLLLPTGEVIMKKSFTGEKDVSAMTDAIKAHDGIIVVVDYHC